jgi:type I restriction enzyme, R subunit
MLPLEREVRKKIDEQLVQAGWFVQDFKDANSQASKGVAIREFPLRGGFADYLLVVNGEAAGVLEVKRGGTLSGVREQSSFYQSAQPRQAASSVRFVRSPLPFSYETNGAEIYFTNGLEPDARSREVFYFHRPEAFEQWLKLAPPNTPNELNDLLRSRVRRLPPLHSFGLRPCQYEAITALEQSFAANRQRALIQMATGSGKTFMSISEIYRLLRHGGAKHILFLVDRINLGFQALNEFQQYPSPEGNRRFTDLYNVQLLISNQLDPAAEVSITTIQRLYSILRGTDEPEQPEDQSLFSSEDDESDPAVEVQYHPALPIEYFDVIFIDECHRSIYNKWRQVLKYFDAFQVGLSATPEQRAFGYFERNLVSEYSYERSVADGVNVDYQLYRIGTDITENGSRVEKGTVLARRNKLTRGTRYEALQDDLVYDGQQVDRDVVAVDQIRTVLTAYRDSLPQLFPGRTVVPKTVIFAKDDNHAEDIVRIVRKVFDKGDNFAKKITYNVDKAKPEELINEFRITYNPRIVVSVDMISTGTDIKPLEVLLFMRRIKSRTFFEQMKGRGCRIIQPEQLRAVTPDAHEKAYFVLVDAVGLTRNLRQDNPPLERRERLPLDKLMEQVANGVYGEENLVSLAGRLGKLAQRMSSEDNARLLALCGKDIRALAQGLVDALDADVQARLTQQLNGSDDTPDERALEEAGLQLAQQACAPFKDAQVRELLLRAKAHVEQIIDDVSLDHVTIAEFDEQQALQTISSFRVFMEQHEEQIRQFELSYSSRSSRQLADIANRLEEELPINLATNHVWQAYRVLNGAYVNGDSTRAATDIYALLRYNMQIDENKNALLESLASSASRNFDAWLQEQEQQRQQPFSAEQRDWLAKIRDRIAIDFYFERDDFQRYPFDRDGGLVTAEKLFGGAQALDAILRSLNERLIA